MDDRLIPDVVVMEGSAVLEILAATVDETLLAWGDALLVLDLGPDGLDAFT